MVDRFLLWFGAGAVCAGVTVGMLAGAGTAHAHTESDNDGGAAKTSQSANSHDNKQDSDSNERTETTAARGSTKPGFGPDAVKAGDVISAVKQAVDDAVAKVVTGGGRESAVATNLPTAVKPGPGRRTAELTNDVVAAVTHTSDRKLLVEKTRQTDPVETPDPVETVDAVESLTTPAVIGARAAIADNPVPPVADRIVRAAAFAPTRTNLALAAPAPAQPTLTAARPIDVPPVLSAIGTLVFGLISLAESVVEGPPMALPGSGVTVKRSTLTIGDQDVPADWYFPEGSLDANGTPPEHVIYLQHGFLARGVFYDYTASYLAQQTNSVVVAPTLTSNIFATDGMWLGGSQMHRAVADLFLDGNTALQDSAEGAGYPAGVALPKDDVLVGHSLGGGLVIDTARYTAADEANGLSAYHLSGVLMLDGVSFTDPVPILRDIPADIPVYNLSGTPYMWNLFGTMDSALAQVRGDQFHGAQLLGGLHSDSMIGGNPLVQFGAYLLTGFSLPGNAAGSQILAATWINDMFDGTRTPGFYGQPGDTLTIPTAVGPAFGLVQPRPGVLTSAARELTAVFIGLLGGINFATDVAPAQTPIVAMTALPASCTATPAAPPATCSAAIAA